MKQLLLAFMALTTISVCAQPWESVKGNGVLKKETRSLAGFSSLESHGSMDVEIAYGSSGKIEVEADENILPYIETTVENGRLEIRSRKKVNLNSRSKMVIYVTMTTINSLELSGSGNVTGKGDFTGDGKTEINVSGSGNIKLKFDAFKDLELAVAGSGNMNLESKSPCNSIYVAISGSGNIDASDVNTSDVDAKISGSGNVKVYASHTIKAKISGSGNVFYRGEAPAIDSKVVGSGKVLKM